MLKIKEITECPPPETILKGLTVDGLMIILRLEEVENGHYPWHAVEAVIHAFMATGFLSLEIHPAFRRQVLTIAHEQFESEYGEGYWEREDWRQLFGENERPCRSYPVQLPTFLRNQ
jgi:hypothetical protein